MKLKSTLSALTIAIGIATVNAGTLHKTVTIGNGNPPLSTQISPDERFTITILDIKGELFSDDDRNYLIDLCKNDSCAITELSLPIMDSAISGDELASTSLTKLTYGDMSYMRGNSFNRCPNLEEVVFDGSIGHIDGYLFNNCPKLKTIIFNNVVFSTGGEQFAYGCPELESVVINGLFYNYQLGKAVECPAFKGIQANGIIAKSGTDAVKTTPSDDYKNYTGLSPLVDKSLWWIDRVAFCNNRWHQGIAIREVDKAVEIARALGKDETISKLYAVRDKRLKNRKESYLDLLKSSPSYRADFNYAPPSDPDLIKTREYFNLDSVAGDGDDISKIKNLMYWVHDLVRHDGSSPWPGCNLNIIDLYETTKRENRGLNCRMMAIMLTEALLAEGIPSRYITCQSEAFDLDQDCHVINVAWSESLDKWVWIDPTFAAYVTDDAGKMLHPGEVRQRLIEGKSITLNEDANWNHKTKQTKEEYLEDYMAKNLFIMSANTINQPEPEGNSDRKQGYSVALVPEGTYYEGARYNTSDYDYFWKKPN